MVRVSKGAMPHLLQWPLLTLLFIFFFLSLFSLSPVLIFLPARYYSRVQGKVKDAANYKPKLNKITDIAFCFIDDCTAHNRSKQFRHSACNRRKLVGTFPRILARFTRISNIWSSTCEDYSGHFGCKFSFDFLVHFLH